MKQRASILKRTYRWVYRKHEHRKVLFTFFVLLVLGVVTVSAYVVVALRGTLPYLQSSANTLLETTITGELVEFHTDDFKGKKSTAESFVVDANGKRHLVKLEGLRPANSNLKPGAKVAIQGRKTHDDSLVAPVSAARVLAVPKAVTTALGPKKLAVLLFNFQNDQSKPWTVEQVRTNIFTGPGSANAYYKESSFGKLSLTGSLRPDGDIFGWNTISVTNDNCNNLYDVWVSQAEQLAAAQGFMRGSYDNIMYVFPSSPCPFGGAANVGGTLGISYINGLGDVASAVYVIAHELGHNFGTMHANRYECSEGGQYVAIGVSCTHYEYGDQYDVMGVGQTKHMHGYHKAITTFLEPARTQTVTSSGRYSMSAIETVPSSTTDAQVLRIPRDYNEAGNVLVYYYLELRKPFGFDNFAAADPVVNGVTIRLAGEPYNLAKYSHSRLLDTTPQTVSWGDEPLMVGKTFTDPLTGFRVKTVSAGGGVATVDVTMPNTRCIKRDPLMTVTPASQQGAPGKRLTYTLTLTNSDSSGCIAARFKLSVSGYDPSWRVEVGAVDDVQVNPQNQYSIPITLTSPTGLPSGSYSFYTYGYDNISGTNVFGRGIYEVVAPPLTGTISADPNPVEICVGKPGQTTITSSASVNYNICYASASDGYTIHALLTSHNSGGPYVDVTGNIIGSNTTFYLVPAGKGLGDSFAYLGVRVTEKDCSPPPPPPPPYFTDVPPSHPFYNEITKIAAKGITKGCGEGKYCPDDLVTREQMAAFIIRALGDFNPPTPTSQRFTDVPPSHPFYSYIEQMALRKITLGCGNGNYCPANPVTREQMAAFLIRALGEFNPPTPATWRFKDVPPTNPFYNFVDRMAALGITQGCSSEGPLYCPTNSVSRAQMAAFLVRAFGL